MQQHSTIIQRRFGRVAIALALVALVILGSVAMAYANSPKDPAAPTGGDVVLPVEPDGGIGGERPRLGAGVARMLWTRRSPREQPSQPTVGRLRMRPRGAAGSLGGSPSSSPERDACLPLGAGPLSIVDPTRRGPGGTLAR